MSISPVISVVIPTFRRLNALIASIQSVKNQSFKEWELIISDDEKPSGKTWNWLLAEAKQDSRVKPVQNPNPSGQVSNTNYGMSQATGQYIKVLHDDDLLLPTCLEEFIHAIHSFPGIEVITCRERELENGFPVKEYRGLGNNTYTFLPSKQAGRYMYVERDVGSKLPTALLVKRSVILEGGYIPQINHVSYCVDAVWNMHLIQFGNRLIINKILVEHHVRNDICSLTSDLDRQDYRTEVLHLRDYQHSILSLLNIKVPSLKTIRQMSHIIFAFIEFRHSEFIQGIKLLMPCRHPYSWLLFCRSLVDILLTTRRYGIPCKRKENQH